MRGVSTQSSGTRLLWLEINDNITRIGTVMTFNRLFTTAIGLLLSVMTVNAIPAKPGAKRSVTLADGTTVELTLRGDEHYSYYVNATGNPCELANGRLVMLSPQQINEEWTARKQKNLNLASAKSSRRASSHRSGTPSAVTTGNQRGLVILIQFSDVKFATSDVQKAYQDFFNKTGYNEGGMTGSVRDYFLKQSYGQLTIDFDVVGPYTAVGDMKYYGEPVKDKDGKIVENDKDAPTLIREAVDAASKDVDFSNYDWDKDGEVDQVFVIYAGYAQAQGADENTIWPHEWSLAAKDMQVTYNGCLINTYGCSSELRGDGERNTGIMDGIGTACHEFSHCLGLPDMYDTTYSGGYGMSVWDIMDYGSYNDNSCTPAGYTSYERWFSRWMEPQELTSFTRITDMKPLIESPEAYIIYNKVNRNEYYLLENRQNISYDKGIGGHGLLILHVDYNEAAWRSNSINNVTSHQRLTIIPADNDFSSSLRGWQGDPWPGRTGNTALTNYTTPAATLFNNNADGTKFMSFNIDNIVENTTNNTISFVAGREDLAAPDMEQSTINAGENSFSITWPTVNGAIGYEVELATIDKAASDPSEALQWQYNFEGCVSKSTGFTDISSKLGSYGLTNWAGSKLFTSPNYLKIGTSSATGYLRTPSWWRVPSSQEITFVMGAAPFTNGTAVKGTLLFESAIEGGTSADIVSEEQAFEVSSNAKQVFSFKVPKQNNLYRLTISPDAQMYLNYLSAYDGTWTAEQLGINSSTRAPRRATVINTYSTATNSYTFTELDTNKRYIYRVRSIGEENTYSQWSEEKTFEFGATGIKQKTNSKQQAANIPIYNLSGQRVGANFKGLVVKEGKKFMNK